MNFGNLSGLISGTESVVYDSTVAGSATNELSTGNILNGNEDGWYTGFFFYKAALDVYACLRFNSDANGNYGRKFITVENTTVADFSGTSEQKILMALCATNQHGFIMFRVYAKSGAVREVQVASVSGITGTTCNYLWKGSGVWNNTSDNVISMQVVTNDASNGFAVGSRLIILKSNNFTNGTPCGSITTPSIRGCWRMIDSKTVSGSSASSVDFTGVDGNSAVLFRLIGHYTSGSATEKAYIRLNDDATTNYGYQLVYAENTSVVATRLSSSSFVSSINSATTTDRSFFEMIMFAKSGFVRPCILQSIDKVNGTVISSIVMHGESWANIADNITKVSVVAVAGNKYSVGSNFELWGLFPNG